MKEILCVRCAKSGKTCCQRAEVYVTKGDVARIADFSGLTAFYEFRLPENPTYLDQDDDPIWMQAVFRRDGHRRVIKRDVFGNCSFLKATGCVLPLEIRPLVCRLYPFEYTADGISLEAVEGDWCPECLMNSGETLIQALDMSFDDARRWHQLLYTEIKEEITGDENRINLRPAA